MNKVFIGKREYGGISAKQAEGLFQKGVTVVCHGDGRTVCLYAERRPLPAANYGEREAGKWQAGW